MLTTHFSGLKHVVLIGGGDLMALAASAFKASQFEVSVIIANRHLDEPLTHANDTLKSYLVNQQIAFHCVDDINQLSEQQQCQLIPEHALAMCFGPAWIFSSQLIKHFSFGMFNINAIPIPHYLGGAHYTWQLLNQDHQGGCFLQQITEQVDQGDILAEHKFTIPENASSPEEYFAQNINEGLTFIKQLIQRFSDNEPFIHQAYETLNEERLYLPRLRTDKQGFVNWQWSATDIVAFIKGFDSPYMGAGTVINSQNVRLKGAKIIKLSPAMHPFATGLIVRKTTSQFVIAAPQGFLTVGSVINEHGQCIKDKLKEGMRFHTPTKLLEQALAYQVILDANGFKEQ